MEARFGVYCTQTRTAIMSDLQQFSMEPVPHCQGGDTIPLRLDCGLPGNGAVINEKAVLLKYFSSVTDHRCNVL